MRTALLLCAAAALGACAALPAWRGFTVQDIVDSFQTGWSIPWFNSVVTPTPSVALLATCRSRTTPAGQCGLELSQSDSDSFVAGVSSGYFGGIGDGIMSIACGKCVNVTAMSGPAQGQSAVVAMLDVIPQATEPQIDLPYNVYMQLGGSPVPGSSTEGQGNFQASLELTPCPDAMQAAMKAAVWSYSGQPDAFFLN